MNTNAEFVTKLKRMRKLLAKPEAWTQGRSARTAGGNDTFARAKDAACWCLLGAALRVELREATFVGPSGSVCMVTWNDAPERTHAEVLACIDNSIRDLTP